MVVGMPTEGPHPNGRIRRRHSPPAFDGKSVTWHRRRSRRVLWLGVRRGNEFCLTEWERHRRETHDDRCWHLCLDDSLLREKLNAAAGYVELKAEIQQAIAAKGQEYFRIECLRNVAEPLAAPFPNQRSPPGRITRRMARSGSRRDKYASVIRYKQHMVPILEAVRDYAMWSGSVSALGLSSTAVAGNP
jgi:hypothetical protein